MTSVNLTQGGKLGNVILHNVIWANQKTEPFVYHWLRAHAMIVVTALGESDVISSILSISNLSQAEQPTTTESKQA